MKAPRRVVRALALTFSALLSLGATPAQEAQRDDACDVIHAIEVRGNDRMSADAIRFDLSIREGDPWDAATVRREYRRFWDRGFFDDLRFLRRCEPEGAVLVIEITERPTIVSVEYEKNSAASETQIEEAFKSRGFRLTIGTPLDQRKLFQAESIIENFLGSQGYLDADVEAEIVELSPSTRKVIFKIRPGGKTRIRKLEFTGNEAFSDRVLRRQLEQTAQYRWYWPWSKKATYSELRYQQDINGVLRYYRNRGYLDVDVRPPVVEVETRGGEDAVERAREKAERKRQKEIRRNERERRKAQERGEVPPPPIDEDEELDVEVKKWVYITVPVEEGPIYELGEIRFEGNELFTDEELRALIPIESGDVLRDSVIELGLGLIRSAYGEKGYVYSAVTRRFERSETGEPVADVVVQIDEDQAYVMRRLEFRGNTKTQDVVLRREFNVFEGELLDRTQLNRSMLKLQQLGYWVPTGAPELVPVPGKAEVDVIVPGEEQSRNEIQVGGGYSELDGGFFLATYQTRNFLGRGESLGVRVAVGGRSSRASLTFTEPWLFGRPWTLGFSLFRNRDDFIIPGLGGDEEIDRTSTGLGVTIGRRFGDFTRIQLGYRFNRVETQEFLANGELSDFEFDLAFLSPAFRYQRLNNFLRPTKGLVVEVIPEFAWDAVGSDLNFFRPRAEVSAYTPLWNKFFLGANVEAGWVKAFGEIKRENNYIQGIPRVERFFLGGDRIGPRVFETRSIFPVRARANVDNEGNPFINNGQVVFLQAVGGSKFGLAQFELGYLVGRSAVIAGFLDAGGTYYEGVDWNWEDVRVSAGLEFRVFLPIFQAPIRLIYGWPIKKEEFDDTSQFQFSIGLPF